MKRSRRYKATAQKIDRSRCYQIAEAVEMVKGLDGVRQDATVEVALVLGIDPKQSDQMVRGSVSLPKGLGKAKRVIVFAEGEAATAAKEAGAVEAGGDELVKKIQDGWLDFDVSVASPRMMPKVGRLGRLLGPKGLMPSPKTGTVTDDVVQAVTEFSAGRIEYRNDSGGNLHAPVGRAGFAAEDLVENVTAFIDHIRHVRPSGSKGTFLKKAYLCAVMSPSIPLEIGAV